MKKCILTAVLFLQCLLMGAQDPYFCNKPGCKLYYERHDADNTRLTQTTNMEIDSLTVLGNGQTLVDYGVTLRKNGKREMFGGRAALQVIIDPNGDVHMDFGASVKAFIHTLLPKAKIKVTGTSALLPSGMKAGDELPEAHCQVSAAGVKVTVDVVERKVLRREQLTTPAGTFDCVVVRERKIENAPFHHLDHYLENWYVAGVGYVRHDRHDKNMKLEDSEILIRYQPLQTQTHPEL